MGQTRGTRSDRALWVALLLALSTLPLRAVADWRDFLPHPLDTAGFADAYTAYERDNQESAGRSTRWDDLYLRQKFTLLSRGYSYHPRFLTYRFSIAGAAREERYDASSFDSRGWQADPGFEYDADLMFLPKHPYNVELYARRYEPLYKEQASTQHNAVDNRRGVDFRYRNKPYFAHAGFLDDEVDSGPTTSRIDRFNVDGQYFNRFTSGNELGFNGNFIPAWFSNTDDLEGDSIEYTVGNFVNLANVHRWAPPVRITSDVSQYFYNQDSPDSPRLKSDQLVWSEWLTATLPWNFRHDLYYRHQDTNSESGGDDRSYKADDVKLDLRHRLYESLDSTYTFRDDWRNSTGGKSTTEGHSLVFAYSKVIPHGRVHAGFNVGTNETDNSGEIDVVDEPFSTSLPMVQGPYVLGQQNVDPVSIRVYLKSPLPPFNRILLDPAYYSVVAIQNTYGVLILDVPPPLVGPGPYDFLVSYSYSGDFVVATDTLGANASVELLESLLMPYASYLVSNPKVKQGTFPGGLAESSTYTAGLLIRYRGLQVRGEYQKLDWEISPYDSWKAEAQWLHSLTDTFHLFATTSYLNRHYSKGNSFYYQESFTEQTETATANLQKQFFERNLNASVGASYARIRGIVDSDSYSLNSSLLWHIGELDVIVGAQIYDSDSSGTTSHTKRDHQWVYMNLRRRIF